MNAVEIDIEGWNVIKAAWAQAPDMVRSELAAAMAEADGMLEREVMDSPEMLKAKASGNLRGSIFSVEEVSETGIIGVVGTAQQYAVPVELGTRPHWPKFAVGPDGRLHCFPLEDWVQAKLGVSAKEARSVAFLVARKISRTGTQGAFMFTHTLERQQQAVGAIFSLARDRIAARLSGKV